MRFFAVLFVSLSAMLFAASAQAESRHHCLYGCSSAGYDGLPVLRNDHLPQPGQYHPPRYHVQPVKRRTIRRSHRRQYHHGHRYHTRSYRKTRRHHGYRKHRSHRRYARPTLHNRTKYCRDELHWIGKRKAVRTCVWVRNDLIYRY
ncbi:MAG: hypothetical protein OXR62_07475 [Ahrensia sp.]|nr:hypothetical protein [Ahrensia sp.]